MVVFIDNTLTIEYNWFFHLNSKTTTQTKLDLWYCGIVLGRVHTERQRQRFWISPEPIWIFDVSVDIDTDAWYKWCNLNQLGFCYFEFKIRLNRLGLSLQKEKFLDLNSHTTDSQSEILTIPPKRQLWVGDREKLSVALSDTWLILVEFTQFY